MNIYFFFGMSFIVLHLLAWFSFASLVRYKYPNVAERLDGGDTSIRFFGLPNLTDKRWKDYINDKGYSELDDVAVTALALAFNLFFYLAIGAITLHIVLLIQKG